LTIAFVHDDDYFLLMFEFRIPQEFRTHGTRTCLFFQDPDDDSDDNSPREVVIICEHSVCDGISLNTVGHELLIALAGDDDNMFANSLSWPTTMETAVRTSLSLVGWIKALGRFILAVLYLLAINRWTTAKISKAKVDFPLTDMDDYCHTEACYSMLSKEETQKLVEKCHQENVSVTSAVSSAILCAVSTLVDSKEDRPSALKFGIVANTRSRCVPPIPNHHLSFNASCIMPFITPITDIPTTSKGKWQLAKIVGNHIKMSIDAGQVLVTGLIMGKMIPHDPRIVAKRFTSVITSLGILPYLEHYGQWKLSAVTNFGNMIQTITPAFLMQTVNGILTIMCFGADPVIPLSMLETLSDRTMQNLRHMMQK
jgi:hypothetical protein